jgi:hypothetical protein
MRHPVVSATSACRNHARASERLNPLEDEFEHLTGLGCYKW